MVMGLSSGAPLSRNLLTNATFDLWVAHAHIPEGAAQVTSVPATDTWVQLAQRAAIDIQKHTAMVVLTPMGVFQVQQQVGELRKYGRKQWVAWAIYMPASAQPAHTLRILTECSRQRDNTPHGSVMTIPILPDTATWSMPMWSIITAHTGIHAHEVDHTELWTGYVDFLDLSHKHTLKWAWQRMKADAMLTVVLMTDTNEPLSFSTRHAEPALPPPEATQAPSGRGGEDDMEPLPHVGEYAYPATCHSSSGPSPDLLRVF